MWYPKWRTKILLPGFISIIDCSRWSVLFSLEIITFVFFNINSQWISGACVDTVVKILKFCFKLTAFSKFQASIVSLAASVLIFHVSNFVQLCYFHVLQSLFYRLFAFHVFSLQYIDQFISLSLPPLGLSELFKYIIVFLRHAVDMSNSL